MIENFVREDLEKLERLHLLIDKMAIGMKRHVTSQFQNGEKGVYDVVHIGNYDRLVNGLGSVIRNEDWPQLAINAACLWFLDWSNFLGRDFLAKGDSPETYRLN